MNAHPEGRLRITLTRGPYGVEVGMASSRLYAASRWFEGKTVAETLRLLPLLFRVCGTAQASAAVSAVENARGVSIGADVAGTRAMIVLAETLREHLLRVLTSWHDDAGAPLTARALDVMRLPARLGEALYAGNDGFTPGGGRLTRDRLAVPRWLDDTRDLLAQVVFGCPIEEWLAMASVDEVLGWAASSTGVAPGFVDRLVTRGWAAKGATIARPLPPLPPGELAERLAGDGADGFLAAPDWHGEVYETGAYARNSSHPMVEQASRVYGNTLLARTLARLVEIAGIPGEVERLFGGGDSAAHQAPASRGTGIGQVEAARGRLVHRITLDGDLVTSYRILAPTEWNFHPRGAVFQALSALDPGDDLRHLGSLLVEAVDPCIGYDLEVSGDA